MAHTPGPWSVPHFADISHPCSCKYVLSDSQSGAGAIATVHHYEPDEAGAQNEPLDVAIANARLIAAAPALLEALEGVMTILGRAESNASGNPEWDHVGPRVEAARAAIALAKGEQTNG